jgi:Cu(I)/Ag(I) efflux system membrane fusion protein
MNANRKRIHFVMAAIVMLMVAGGFFVIEIRPQSAHAAEGAEQLYTCSMDPQVVQNHPGNCPICGMKLTPKRPTAQTNSTDASAITIDPVTMQNMGFRSESVTHGSLSRTIRTVGTIDFDETRLADVTARFRGWIEKLYVDSTGEQVRRGDPLFEIHSPELYSAEMDYFMTLNQPAASTNSNVTTNLNSMAGMNGNSAKARAVAKLKLFDLTDEQILKIGHDHEVRKTLSVPSPADGFVTEKSVVQGQMVDPGMKLYRIADLEFVWVQAQVYEQDLPFVKLGQEADVSLSYLPDRKFRGRVAYIYPTVDEKTRTVKVRMEFHNPGYLLKPGMFTTVELRAELAPDALLVPDSAVLRSGQKDTVFVARDGGKFEPRIVTLGPRGEGDVFQVLSGLNAGERVVTSGQFMLDSESQLREVIQKMLPLAATNSSAPAPTAMTMPMTEKPAMSEMPAMPATSADTNIVYICPMSEHVAIRYDHPGKCPLCSMTLVPVSEAAYNKTVEEKWRAEHPANPQP